MKKRFISAILGCGVVLSAAVSWGQNQLPKALIGTPDEYQDYFVFNKFGNMNVAYWLVEINEIIPINDSTNQNRLEERIRVTDRNFIKLDERYKNMPIHVEIKGFNSSNTLIAFDDWDWQPIPDNMPYWDALCSATCVGPTYAYTISVLAQYEPGTAVIRTGNNLHHIAGGFSPSQVSSIGNFGGNPVGIWRNFGNIDKAAFCSYGNQPNGLPNPDNNYANINAPKHHGHNWCPEALYAQWDGVNFMFIPGANNNGFTYHRHDGSLIGNQDNVWRVKKAWGKWGEFSYNLSSGTFLISEGLNPSPETRCGTMPQNGMIYGSALLNMWNPILAPLTDQESNGVVVSNPLVCQQMAAGSGGSGGSTGNGWNRPFVWTVSYTGIVWPKLPSTISGDTSGLIFEVLSDIQDINLGEFNGSNSTGIPWWPGDDVAMVQIYKVDQNPQALMHEPISLLPSNLIDENGNLIPLNFILEKGLYNMVFLDHDDNSFMLIFELENAVQHTLEKSDFVDIIIYPNPFDSQNNQISTALKSTISARYTYTIIDANNQLYHHQQGHVLPNVEVELIIRTQNLPVGQLFHKFVFDDGSVKILQTLKN